MPHPTLHPRSGGAAALRALVSSALVAVAATLASARDPWTQPFAPESIWNTPIGTGAVYEPINIGGLPNLPAHSHVTVDPEYLLRPRKDAPVRILYQAAGWSNRSFSTATFLGRIRIPDNFLLPDTTSTDRPNNCTVILANDRRTVWELNAFTRPAAGGNAWAYEGSPQDLYGLGTYGAHAGSGLSTLGGSLRKGELTGPDPIRHALKILIRGRTFLNYNSTHKGYRWPAVTADHYAGDPNDPSRYLGTNPKLLMGAHLAIPPTVSESSLGLQTTWGRKLFAALRDYGAYIVDDSAWDAFYLNADHEAISEFNTVFGYSMVNSSQFRAEMNRLIPHLRILDNNVINGVPTPGGPGARRVTPVGPLTPYDPATGNAFDRGSITFGGDMAGGVSKDGDLNTYRTSASTQSAAQTFFTIDLGGTRTFDRITLETGPSDREAFPRSLNLWASTSAYWHGFVNGGDYVVLQARGEGKTHIRFKNARSARYLTIQNNTVGAAQGGNNRWRLAEVNIHYDNDPAATEPAVVNLVPNGGFESGLSGWDNWNGAATLVTDRAEGAQAIRIGPAEGGVGRYPTLPTGTSTVRVRFAAKADTWNWTAVQIQFLNSNWQTLGAPTSVTVNAGASQWTQFQSGILTVPSGATRFQIWAWKSGSTGQLWVDDIRVIP